MDTSPSKNLPFRIFPSFLYCVVDSEYLLNWTQFTNFCSTLFVCNNFSISWSVQFRSHSKLEFSYGYNLQWWKPFFDLFSSSRNKAATIGDHLKKILILSSESVNMLIHGVVATVRMVKNHSKRTSIAFFLSLKHIVSTLLSLLWASEVATEL